MLSSGRSITFMSLVTMCRPLFKALKSWKQGYLLSEYYIYLCYPLFFRIIMNWLFITDINAIRIYCGIWQNSDSENQHQSNGRLFQCFYKYGLHFIRCFGLQKIVTQVWSWFRPTWYCPRDRCYHNIVFTDICLYWFWDRIVNALLVPQLALGKPLRLCVPCSWSLRYCLYFLQLYLLPQNIPCHGFL